MTSEYSSSDAKVSGSMAVTGTLASLRPDNSTTETFTEFKESEAPKLLDDLKGASIKLEHGLQVPDAKIAKAWVEDGPSGVRRSRPRWISTLYIKAT